jgi:DNA ligase (NAD+)
MAWKFDPAMGVTKVLDIRWQNGPTGRITPVAILEPVDVGGVTIANVSLHNLSMFRDLGLWRGCEVLISRRNDVIPYVERNLSAEAQDGSSDP